LFPQEIPKAEFTTVIQQNWLRFQQMNPNASPTQKLIYLNRLYEKLYYGVTSEELSKGIATDYIEKDGKIYEVKSRVKGHFSVSGEGRLSSSETPIACYRREYKSIDGKRQFEWIKNNKRIDRIELASEHTTSSDILTKGDAVLYDAGIDTGYGGTTGVIQPEFVDLFLKLASELATFKNFVKIFPMRKMTFWHPLKTSKPSDNASVSATAAATAEGRAGLEFAISYNKWLVNGWKYLRHAGLTVELMDITSDYWDIRQDYLNDLAIAMALLWDYTVAEGMFTMLWEAKWRRWDITGPGFAAGEYVPLSGASGAEILTSNALKHYAYQDLSNGTNHGKIYLPHTSTPTQYQTSTLKPGSGTTDDLFELILHLGTLLKNKGSKLEYVAMPASLTEFLFKDSRFLSTTEATGNPAFQSESGYLGQIAIGGSNSRVDVWEYDPSLLTAKQSTDDPVVALTVIYAGSYQKQWNLGIYTPYYIRVDDGFEVMTDVGSGDSEVLRPNETRVITAGSRGSSFPGDYHHLVLGLVDLATGHS